MSKIFEAAKIRQGNSETDTMYANLASGKDFKRFTPAAALKTFRF